MSKTTIFNKQQRIDDIREKYRMAAEWFVQFSSDSDNDNDRYMLEAVEDIFLRVYGRGPDSIE
jgi:hypothetical protein